MGDTLTLSAAAAATRTGDIWLFRGHKAADRTVRLLTNSPVNHVAMAVTIGDLPPLLWHTELGMSLVDVWTGTHHRGAQVHRLEDAVAVWADRYGQQAWLRQISINATPEMEDELLRTINEFSGRSFPRSTALAREWALGRVRRGVPLEDLYCAELVAVTYQRMGLLGSDRPPNWYDPGRFWSGDHLHLKGASLSPEVGITELAARPAATEGM